ncbi:ABC1 kinase family protein [Acinetobacter soli]|uniref:ABC1 kinase family protein n=1 Tax=Acinetobacter soli TaxID=487316 RepID=UPI00125040B8|nr:AarF/ABC1/UbiB kinase family protein [Acinetobacter soli]MCE6006968.1 AarF/ABC1/UbiB kinase family protein [Acinetobacter soli]
MAKNASSPGRRFMKLAGMTASIATKTVSNSIRHLTADEEQKLAAKTKLFQDIGIQIAETLGEMKGAVMKVGQIASQYKDIFPPEVAQSIAKLQRQAPAVPFATIRTQVEKELGKPLDVAFQSFEPTPFAAASIGQVHRARLHDGQEVVVKVQYPGVDEACESDLKQVRLALRLMGVIKIDKKLQDKLFAEIQESLSDELNYEIEAQNLEVFKTFHQSLDAKVVIPSVFKAYSTRRVLTLSLEPGESLETASTWPLEVRNTLARRLIRTLGQEMFYLKRFHCDSHPGNFAFRPDGTVVIYDFGGVKTLSVEIVEHFKQLIYAARKHNIPVIEDHLEALQALAIKSSFPEELYIQWIDVLLRPLTQPYNFAENSAYHDSVTLVKKSLKYWDVFRPSPDTLMVNRTISGHYWNLIHLKVEDNLNDLFEELVPNPS